MIMSWPCLSLRPVLDSLPVCTWRGEGPIVCELLRAQHRYPVKGCQGGPLPERSPCGAAANRSWRELTAHTNFQWLTTACACEETP